MKIQFGDDTLLVQFRYSKRNSRARRHTECRIVKVEGEDRTVVSRAEVVCDTRDRDIKAVARKRALSAAMRANPVFFEKTIRENIWKQVLSPTV